MVEDLTDYYKKNIRNICRDELTFNSVVLFTNIYDNICMHIISKAGNCGMNVAYYPETNHTYLVFIAVDEDIRKLGVGKNLVEVFEEISDCINASYMEVQVEKETWRHDWFLRMGYIISTETESTNEDWVVLTKKLNNNDNSN